MTLLVISPDYVSHGLPLLTMADAWRATGERVVVATGPALAGLVERAGMDYLPLVMSAGSNPGVARPEHQPAGEDDNLRAFFAATRLGAVAALRQQALSRSRDLLWRPQEVAQATIRLVDAVRPDAVIVDHLAFGPALGLRAAGVAHADAVLGHPRQLPVAGETYGVPGAWPRSIRPDADELGNLEREARHAADRFTDAYNSALLALNPNAAAVHDAFAAHGDLVLLNYPQAMHERERTARLPGAHAFLGGLVRRERPDPATGRWLDRADERPLVVVSLGTFLSARTDVLAVVAAGLRPLDVRVALAVGSADVDQLGPLPSDWLVAEHLPQVALLERSAALITHCGNNSVTEAVAFGVPILGLPFSTDQFDGAAAVERAGFGHAADPNTLRPETVAHYVAQLVERAHPGLHRLAGEVAARPGAKVARSALSEWLGAGSSHVVVREG